MSDYEVDVVEVVDLGLIMQSMMEFHARGLVMSQRAIVLLHIEISGREKKKALEELVALKEEVSGDKAIWAEGRNKVEEEVKKLKGRLVGVE